jgi:hypothetical protein
MVGGWIAETPLDGLDLDFRPHGTEAWPTFVEPFRTGAQVGNGGHSSPISTSEVSHSDAFSR